MKIIKAEIGDLPVIFSLQKLTYQSKAKLVGVYSIPPLTQTIDSKTNEFKKMLIK